MIIIYATKNKCESLLYHLQLQKITSWWLIFFGERSIKTQRWQRRLTA